MRQIVFALLLTLGMFMNTSAQSFDEECVRLIKTIAANVDKDSRTFDKEIESVENRINLLNNKTLTPEVATRKAVLHCIAAWAYHELPDRYSDVRNDDVDYMAKRDEHLREALKDKRLLASQQASKYKALVKLGKDGSMFNHCMLAVIADYYFDNSFCSQDEKFSIYEEMISVYESLNMNKASDALTDEIRYAEIMRNNVQMRTSDDEFSAAYRDSVVSYWKKVVEENADSRFISEYRNNLNGALMPVSRIKVSDFHLPEEDLKIDVCFWNCDKAHVFIREFNGYEKQNGWQSKLRLDGKVVASKTVTLGYDPDNVRRREAGLCVVGKHTEKMGGLKPGKYVVVVKSLGGQNTQLVHVSSFCMVPVQENDGVRVYTLDAVSGKPVAGVSVDWVLEKNYGSDVVRKGSGVTDNDGECFLKLHENKGRVSLKASRAEGDTVSLSNVFFSYSVSDKEYRTTDYTKLFTDRLLYRPGQTVKVAGVLYCNDAKDSYVTVSGHASEVSFFFTKDRGDVQKEKVTSNEYGTFSCEFRIPDNAKVGEYIVSCGKSSVTVRVEEYKRPTWSFSLEGKAEGRLALGDTMMVEGKAVMFSGVPVQGADVQYDVFMSPQYYRPLRSRNAWRVTNRSSWKRMENALGHGQTKTDADGKFSISLPLVAENVSDVNSICFKVVAKVTDQAGETREEEYYTVVSVREYMLELDAGHVVDLSKEGNMVLKALDVLGNSLDVFATCEVKLDDKVINKVKVQSNTPYTLSYLCGQDVARMPMGEYVLNFQSRDSRGNDITLTAPYVIQVYDSNVKTASGRDVMFKDDFFYCEGGTFSKGRPARIYFIPAKENSYVIRYVTNNKMVFGRETGAVSKTVNVYEVYYDDSMQDGAVFSLFYVNDGNVTKHRATLKKVVPEKNMRLSWNTFRDHVQPGKKETWVLSVKSPDGKQVSSSEMIATLYDASLDDIHPYAWSFSLPFARVVSETNMHIPYVQSSFEFFFNGDYKSENLRAPSFDRFCDFYEISMLGRAHGRNNFMHRPLAAVARGVKMDMAGLAVTEEASLVMAKKNVMTDSSVDLDDVYSTYDEGDSDSNVDEGKIMLRSKFAETAFFYPHLVSDKDGMIRVSFTLPESLTEWKFMGFVHDERMNNGVMTSKTMARKPFVVQPNMPRFVRVGDDLNLMARIINQDEASLNGYAVICLRKAKDESLVYADTIPFCIDGMSTTTVSFPYQFTDGADDMLCDVFAVSDDVSDGERNLLPVLPSRVQLSESVPFYINGSGEKDVNLKSLFNGDSPSAYDKSMRVEYTDNPVWTVIDALRGVQVPSWQNAPSFAASIYANSKLLELADSLKRYTDKKVVDTDSAKSIYERCLSRLSALRCADGSFKWFDGMREGSYYVTLLVAEQLSRMTDKSDMLYSALSYLDSVQVRNYKYRKAHKISHVPSETDLHYLLVCSCVPGRKVSGEVRLIHDTYLNYVEKHQNELSIYGVASSSVMLRSFFRRKSADRFVGILKSYLVEDKGQGLHFATKRALYSWRDYRIPTQVAAMRSIYALNPNDSVLRDMQLWLLRQKQVQSWDCAETTCEVTDLILRISPNISMRKGEEAQLSIDGVRVDNHFVSDSTMLFAREMGYVNTPVDVFDTLTSVSSLKVVKKSDGVSWGAVTVSFTDESSHVKSYTTGEVSVSRRIMVYDTVAGIGKWRFLNDDESLRVGQKVRVRHTLTTDRDMDFMCVKMPHPACFEPVDKLSGYYNKGALWCFQSIHDSYVEMFFERYREGTSTLDIDYYVSASGTYNFGVSSAQCMYATMYGGHSNGLSVTVNP